MKHITADRHRSAVIYFSNSNERLLSVKTKFRLSLRFVSLRLELRQIKYGLEVHLHLKFESMEAFEWEILREAAEEKATLLMRHEKKDYAIKGMDLSKFKEIRFGNRTFYTISTNVFKVILDKNLVEAVEQFPDQFGTGRAEDVLDAIFKVEPLGDLDDFERRLRTENFSWLFELTDGELNSDVLRIDLFRILESEGDSLTVFTGGVFHAFKHFSYQGIPLSYHNEIHDLNHPNDIVNILIQGFFFQPKERVSDTVFKTRVSLDNDHDLMFVFYYEPNTQVYFIKSVSKRDKVKTN